MAWENTLDRLVMNQIHLAETGEVRAQQVQQLVRDMCAVNPERSESSFHVGYAKILLGLDLPAPPVSGSSSRWFTFGMLRAHDRRGERNWVVEMIQDPTRLIDLLSEPEIAASCLPVVMRSLFGCGDLELAMNAIEYFATTSTWGDPDLLVDASLNDLLSRLETMLRNDQGDRCGPILRRCMELDAFGHLPVDIRARYYRALGQYHLQCGEFAPAANELRDGYKLAETQLELRSSIAFLAGLAALKLHEFSELTVCGERIGREPGEEWFRRAVAEAEHAVPEAWFGIGVIAYEQDDLEGAVVAFDHGLQCSRRSTGRDEPLLNRCRFYLAAALLNLGDPEESNRAVRLLENAIETVATDLETFYPVHEELKKLDRKVALKFLDAVEVERGTAPDQLLIIALEYLGLGESAPASNAARRVLEVAVDLDQRVEAMRILLTCCNMQGDRQGARSIFEEIRDLLCQRGAFAELETLLQNEEFVGQALDHVEIKCELVALYEEMEDREVEKATLQTAIARSLRARKDVGSMQEACGILNEVAIRFPELVRDDLRELEKLLALQDAEPVNLDEGAELVRALEESLGHVPRILVVGGNERQRRHHARFEELAGKWAFDGEWLMANYKSPQKLVSTIAERLKAGNADVLILLHWNRHETTEPALEAARRYDIPARTVHYAGFTSLQVSLTEMLSRLVGGREVATSGGGKGRRK